MGQDAKILDGFYLPTRYANGHPEGAPFEYYGIIQSTDGILYATEIIEFVRSQMA
jgi:HEPN domain-containing protein